VLARFESTAVGQALISLLLIVTVGAVLVVNMPASLLRQDLGHVTQPILNATGLDQNWAVFSRPRTMSAYVFARIEYADHTSSVATIPSGHGLDAYVDYRWQKYEEQIRLDDGAWLWARYAKYVANTARENGRQPVQVSLVRRWADTNPPGPGPERVPWREFTFYVLTVGPVR
jgi:hypothetical protein